MLAAQRGLRCHVLSPPGTCQTVGQPMTLAYAFPSRRAVHPRGPVTEVLSRRRRLPTTKTSIVHRDKASGMHESTAIWLRRFKKCKHNRHRTLFDILSKESYMVVFNKHQVVGLVCSECQGWPRRLQVTALAEEDPWQVRLCRLWIRAFKLRIRRGCVPAS